MGLDETEQPLQSLAQFDLELPAADHIGISMMTHIVNKTAVKMEAARARLLTQEAVPTSQRQQLAQRRITEAEAAARQRNKPILVTAQKQPVATAAVAVSC